MIGAAASMPTILEFVGIQEECNPTTTLVAPSSPPLAAFSRANTHSSAFAQHALVGGNDSAPLPPLNPLATRSGALDTPVGSITTPSLAAAIVAAASLRRGLSCAEEVEDAAAFAAQVIRPTATDLLTAGLPVSSPQQLAAQWDENDVAEVVIVAEPEAAAVGSLHPRGSLFEKPVNSDLAKAQHAKLREVLAEHGARVLTVRDILAYNVEERLGARLELEALAASALTYQLAEGTQQGSLTAADLHHLSDAYKAEVVSALSTSQLIEICLLNPTVTLTPSYRDTGLTASYSFEPLTNLVYTRDQQITTGRGVVMARLRSAQRQKEAALMAYCWQKLGVTIAGAIEAPGFLEGGDFFPVASRDLSLIGIGLRSNYEACRQLMDRDLLGTTRVGVVRDDFDRHQDRMHLDCVFSILGEGCCLMLDTIMGQASPTRRLVDEYVRDPATGRYVLVRSGVELSEFIRGEGFDIIPISNEHQLAYACNVLNLGGGRIISVHDPSARQILQHPSFKGDVQVIDFSSVTSMYGSVHCATQVIRRTPPAAPRSQHPATARALAAAEAQRTAAAAAASAAAAQRAAAGSKAVAAVAAQASDDLPDALTPIGMQRINTSAFEVAAGAAIVGTGSSASAISAGNSTPEDDDDDASSSPGTPGSSASSDSFVFAASGGNTIPATVGRDISFSSATAFLGAPSAPAPFRSNVKACSFSSGNGKFMRRAASSFVFGSSTSTSTSCTCCQ